MSHQAMKFTDEKTRPQRSTNQRASSGFSLIEMMIALVLGLIVIAGAGSVFVASRRTYQTNHALSDVQQNSRIAFELLARDVRAAGLTGCNNSGRLANVLNNGPTAGGTAWWADLSNAVHGYESGQTDPAASVGTSQGQRVAGTDSVQLISAEGSGLSVAETPSGPAANFKLNEKTTDLKSGDAIIVCDPDHAALVQVTVQNGSNVTLVHNTGNTVSPGNCSKGLGYPSVCTTNGNSYTYGRNSQIAKLTASDWYIGNTTDTPADGRSLYRASLVNMGGTLSQQVQEMVRNVTDMTLAYHQGAGATFIPAASVTNWSAVDAVRMTLTLQSSDQRAGTGYKPVSRKFTSTTTVRNRVN